MFHQMFLALDASKRLKQNRVLLINTVEFRKEKEDLFFLDQKLKK